MSTERFSKLKFKIHELKGLVIDKYPVLESYKAIKVAKEYIKNDKVLDKLLRYTIYMYDPGTDLTSEIPDLTERKAEARKLAGFTKADDKMVKAIEDGLTYYENVFHCFFLEIYFDRKHREWHTAGHELDYYTKKRWDTATSDTYAQRKQLSDFCDSIHRKMDALEAEMFGDHADIKASVIADRWSSPEKYAAPTLQLLS